MAIDKSRLDEIRAWLGDGANYPSQQGIYRFSTAKSYYEELSQIYKFLVAYKDELEFIEDNTLSREVLDEAIATLEEEIAEVYATQEDLESYLSIASAEETYTPLSSFSELETTVSGKQPMLTAGENISIVNNVISASGDLSVDWIEVANKPLINNNTLVTGNNTSSSLGLQDELVSGTNIKTVANASLLGSGNIDVVVPSTLNDYVAKADATGYNDILTQTSASSTYVAKADATGYNDILTQTSASSTYLTQASASSTYLTQSSASSTYLTQSSASSTYLTQTGASNTYAVKGRTFTNITVSGTPVQYTDGGQQAYPEWDSEQEYGYYLDVTLTGITADDMIENIVMPTALTDVIASYVDTNAGSIRLWTKDATTISSSIISMYVRSIA